MLKAFMYRGDVARAAAWYSNMRAKGVRVNAKTFGKLIQAAAQLGNVSEAEHWYAEGRQ